MFYQTYLHHKALRTKRQRQLEKQRQIQNAPITIRDLVVQPKNSEFSYGESQAHKNCYAQTSTVTRLIHHIQTLVSITNQYHKEAYCELTEDGSYQLKKKHYNMITRLSLNEFSLYGEQPLTMTEFQLVVNELCQMAQNSLDNVHLLLSSFSVEDSNRKLLNVTLYMQGGSNAKVDTVSKAISSKIDVTYKNTSNFSKQKIGHTTSHVSCYVAGATQNTTPIANNSVFEIETKGGARYTQAVDICFDHNNEHSKRLGLQ